jgi:hypothetical protein
MSKHTTTKNIVDDESLSIFEEDDIADDDYVFVIKADGTLKSIMLPDDVPFKQPKNIGKILKMFDIPDIDNMDGNATIH